ncbi:MAG: hypothetical protein KKD90_06460 [Candidatus Omnitrophica bacterium]|nr:hypothetical protein [Candidatus Omnitrophota bacterium]
MEKIKKGYNLKIVLLLSLAFIFTFESTGYSLSDAAYQTNLRVPIGVDYNRVKALQNAAQPNKDKTNLTQQTKLVLMADPTYDYYHTIIDKRDEMDQNNPVTDPVHIVVEYLKKGYIPVSYAPDSILPAPPAVWVREGYPDYSEEKYFFRLPAKNKDGVQMKDVMPASGRINWQKIIGERIEETGEKGVMLPDLFQIIAKDQASLELLVEELRKKNFKIEASSNKDAIVTMPNGKIFSIITKKRFDDLAHDQVLKRFTQAKEELGVLLSRYRDPWPPIFNPPGKNTTDPYYLETLSNRRPTNFSSEENLYKFWAEIVIQAEFARVERLNDQAPEAIFSDFVLETDDDGNASWFVKLNANLKLSSGQRTRLIKPIGGLEQLFYEISKPYSLVDRLSRNSTLSSSI